MKKPEKRRDQEGRARLPRPGRTVSLAAAAAASAILLGLAACSSESSSDYSQIIEFAQKSWSGSGQDITLEQAAAVPYASIGVRLGDGPQRMLVLATDSGGEQLWTSASHIVLALRNGRIVRTVGFGSDLGGLTLMGSGDLKPPSASLGGAVHQTLTADLADMNAYATPVACTAKKAARESIHILGREIRTVRIDEQCEAAHLDWSFANTYWLDPDSGEVWRSLQHIHPGIDAVEIEVLRPPAG